jgi:hypothetical protein
MWQELIICGLLAINDQQVEIWEPIGLEDHWQLERTILICEIRQVGKEVVIVDRGGRTWFIQPRVIHVVDR